jgi:amidase
MVVAAIGTETDGSIVCPASVNGVVGFKPTVGLVSRRGIVPIAHSQDTAGPMTRSVADAAIILDAIAGADSTDPATGEADARRTGFRAALDEATLRGRRIGVVRDHGSGAGEESKAILDAAVATLEAQGAEIVDPVALPRSSDYSDDELAVLLFELRAGLGEYLRERGTATVSSLADVIAFNQREVAVEMPWFGQELFLQAERNGGIKPAEYLARRERIRRLAGPQGIDRALAAGRLDALVAITCGPAWVSDLVYGDNPGVSCSSSPAAIAGYPSASVPAGFVDGLPVGVSFTAGAWQDGRVLAIAHAFERAHAARKPPTYRTSVDAR